LNDVVNPKFEVIEKQREWASSANFNIDEKGYLPDYESNLFMPMNKMTHDAFEKGSGSELLDKDKSPAKMRAVHSSSALAVNVFDYWVSESNHCLLSALDIDDDAKATIRFEGKYPTGLGGNPPNLDVVLELDNGKVIGIESKFTEWFTPKTQSKTPFKDKYFSFEQGVWARVDLPDSQKLAEKMQQSEVVFRHLDAPQLLKHALGLATSIGNKFCLFYVYFDYKGNVGEIHRQEIQQFSGMVGGELAFKALSYQTLIGRLVANKAGSDAYRSYLRNRYLYGAASI
jgi:hypothetical protein